MTLGGAAPFAVPPLAADEAHLWHASAAAGLPLANAILGADDLARARRFRVASDRDRWLGARAVLRDLLARYGIARPGEPLAVGIHGKPLAPGRDVPRFNLSHAADDVLVAIAWTDVGVDVEHPCRGDVVELARVGLGEKAAAVLRALPRDQRTSKFLRLWTGHEARVKAVGTGLSGPPPPAAVVARSIDLGTGAAAVAARDLRHVRLLTWRGRDSAAGRP